MKILKRREFQLETGLIKFVIKNSKEYSDKIIGKKGEKMCEELEEELERGETAARDLIEHFENMGNPEKCSIPIETDKGCYIIEIRKTF